MRAAPIALLTGLIAYTMFTGKHAPEDPYAVPSQIFVLLLFWLFWPLSLAAFSCLTSVATAARQPGILGLHDYEIREDGLLEKTDVNESLSRWAGIQSVKETRSHLLIWQSPGLIHVIPRRSFADPGACRRFAELVRQKAEEAKRQ